MTLIPRVILGDFDGEARLRVARPGFDVTDPDLGNEQLAFDSGWPEILSVLDASWLLSGSSTTESWSADGTTYTRRYRTVTFDALPWEPICIGWTRQVISDQVQYRQTPSCSYVDHCTFSIPTAPDDTAYIIFANPLAAVDSREADNGGSYNLLAGNHPTRGPGLFVPRRGADVLTCPDTDLRLTIERPPFQIAEAGAVWAQRVNTTPSAPSPTWYIQETIALQGAYPDFPPVILLAGEDRSGAASVSSGPVITWIDQSTIYVRFPSSVSQAVQYIIPAYDPAYVHGADAAATPRVLMDETVGLAVSRKDVNVLVATDAQLLFRATRPMLHVSERHAVDNAGGAASGSVALATRAVGPPIGIFGAYHLGRWWSTIGGIVTSGANLGAPATLPGSPNQELAAWVNSDKRLRYSFAASNTTPNLRVAILDHSATLLDDADLYTGPALQAESTYDDFAGATVGAAPPGWTRRYQAFSGNSVLTASLSGSISGKAIHVYWAGTDPGNLVETTFDAPGSAVTDCDILAGLYMTNGPVEYAASLMFRRSAVNTHQEAGLFTDVVSGAAVDKRIFFGPTIDDAAGAALFDWAYDTFYWLRLNVRGEQRRMKIWARGAAEPAFWTLSFVGPGSASGYVGIAMVGTPVTYAHLDFFSICTTGRPAWGPLT